MSKIHDFFKTPSRIIGITGFMLIMTQCGEEATLSDSETSEPSISKLTRSEGLRDRDGQELAQTQTTIPLAPAEWAGKNPSDIAEQLKAQGEWKTKKGEFYKTWGIFDPEAALAHIETGERGGFTGLKASVIQGWASSDITTAKEWIGKQPLNAERAHYVTQAIRASREDKKSVERNTELESWLLNEQKTPGIKQAIRVYATPLLEQDLQGTLQWISKGLEKGTLRSGVARGIMKYTASQNRVELRDRLTDWMTNATPGDFRDDMIYAYVQETAKIDPETTLSWAQIIKDEDLKESAVKICERVQ